LPEKGAGEVTTMDFAVAAGYVITVLLICFNTYLVMRSDVEIDEENQPREDIAG
jgi:hypothetical protein